MSERHAHETPPVRSSIDNAHVAAALVVVATIALYVIGGMLAAVPMHVRAFAQSVGAVGGAAAAAALIGLSAPPGPLRGTVAARAVVLGVALSIFGAGLLSLIDAALPASPFMERYFELRGEALDRLLRPDELRWIPVVFLVVAVAPGVCEEWLFRGVAWRAMSEASSDGRLFVTSALFAMAHLDPVAAWPLLVVGVALGVLRQQTGGWAAPMVAHIALNTFSGVVLVRVSGLEEASPVVAVAMLVFGLAVTVVLLRPAGR